VKVTNEKKTPLALPTLPRGAYERYVLAANSVQQQRMGPFCGRRGVFLGACVWCMFGKSSLALVSK